ncbi:unnamed protein product [Nezara viridula]|uniref:Uncharacterized protein n=1 Tax=Nezara viridula TaxID=85310 RepID=A0A9P0MLM7_NEZVI|nr:unnamed protein product [Nezara viridula]
MTLAKSVLNDWEKQFNLSAITDPSLGKHLSKKHSPPLSYTNTHKELCVTNRPRPSRIDLEATRHVNGITISVDLFIEIN